MVDNYIEFIGSITIGVIVWGLLLTFIRVVITWIWHHRDALLTLGMAVCLGKVIWIWAMHP